MQDDHTRPGEYALSLPSLTARARATPVRILQTTLLLWMLLVLNSGCTWATVWIRGEEPCLLDTAPTLSVLLEHLNRTPKVVHGWQCHQVRISSSGSIGLPISLSAMLMLERPRDFRLMAHSVVGNEVDLGSNQDHLWFWIRQAEPKAMFTARHDQMDVAQQRLPIPFRPEWLIEALGVIPIDEAETTIEYDEASAKLVRLIRYRVTPRGEPVRMVSVVDTCRVVILEHSLYNEDGVLVASAQMGNHQLDPTSGAVLPHEVRLFWPQEKLGMTLKMGRIDINPVNMPPEIFQRPEIPGYPLFDLGRTAHGSPHPHQTRSTLTPPSEQPSGLFDDQPEAPLDF